MIEKKKSTLLHEDIALGFILLLYCALFVFLSHLRLKAFFSYEWEDIAYSNALYSAIGDLDWMGIKSILFSNKISFHLCLTSIPYSFLYKLFNSIYGIYIITTLSTGIGCIALFKIAKSLKWSLNESWLLAISFLLYAPKNNLIFLDGDNAILMLPLMLFSYLSYINSQKKMFYFLIFAIGSTRSEGPLYLFFATLFNYIFMERDKKILLWAIICLAWFGANLFLEHHFSTPGIFYSTENGLIFRLTQLVTLGDLHSLKTLFKTILIISTPLFFLNFTTPVLLIAAPSIMMALIATEFNFQRAHYFSAFIAMSFISLVFFLNNSQKRSSLLKILLILCCLSNFVPNIIGEFNRESKAEGNIEDKSYFNIRNIYNPIFYTPKKEDKIIQKFLDKIPSNASVSSTGDILPNISSRKKFYQLLDDKVNYLDVDFIIINLRNRYMGAGHYRYDEEKLQQLVQDLSHTPHWKKEHIERVYFFSKIQ